MRLLLFPPDRFVIFSKIPPSFIPSGYRYFSSWHSKQSGYISLRSFRLPFLWVLILRHVPSQRRLAQLRLPLP